MTIEINGSTRTITYDKPEAKKHINVNWPIMKKMGYKRRLVRKPKPVLT